ncbi:hypothetical protein PG988_005911 [Apiospora saccharicola]
MSTISRGSFLGASIAMMVITTLITGVRTAIMVKKGVRFHWDDLWLALGYVLLMLVAGTYCVNAELFFRVQDAVDGRSPMYDLNDDLFSVQKVVLFTSPGLWFTLWSVKFSFLALYKRLMVQVPVYVRIWWFVVVFCILVSFPIPTSRATLTD